MNNETVRPVRGVVIAAVGAGVLVTSAATAYLARLGIGPAPIGAGPDRVAAGPGADRSPESADEHGDRLVRRGRTIYRAHCLRCHGPEGRGDGPDAHALSPPVRDLAGPWRRGRGPEEASEAIVSGVPGTAMAGLGASLSARELEALVAFVMELADRPSGAGLGPEPRDPEGLTAALERAGFTPEPRRAEAPPLSLVGPGGEARTLEEQRGRWVLVHFWGISCGPCLRELPGLGRLAARIEGGGVALLAICADATDPDEAGRALDARAEGLRAVVDRTGLAMPRYGATTLPTTVLVDPDGRLVARRSGAIDWDSGPVEDLIRAVLGTRSGVGPPRRGGAGGG